MSLLQPVRGLNANRPAIVAGGAAEEEVLSANDILEAERTSPEPVMKMKTTTTVERNSDYLKNSPLILKKTLKNTALSIL